MKRRVNKNGLAKTLGVSLPAIDAWVRRGCPYEQKGDLSGPYVFDIPKVMAWREQQAAEAAASSRSNVDITEAQRRKTAAQAALAELELAREQKQVVATELVHELVDQQFQLVTDRLARIPDDAAPQLLGVDDLPVARDILEQTVRAALTDLSGT